MPLLPKPSSWRFSSLRVYLFGIGILVLLCLWSGFSALHLSEPSTLETSLGDRIQYNLSNMTASPSIYNALSDSDSSDLSNSTAPLSISNALPDSNSSDTSPPNVLQVVPPKAVIVQPAILMHIPLPEPIDLNQTLPQDITELAKMQIDLKLQIAEMGRLISNRTIVRSIIYQAEIRSKELEKAQLQRSIDQIAIEHPQCHQWSQILPRFQYPADVLRKTAVFMHIPKCSGTFYEQLLLKKKPSVGSVKSGHPDFNYLTTVFSEKVLAEGRTPFYMVVLRDPVQRVVSEYYHILHNTLTSPYPILAPWDRYSLYYNRAFFRSFKDGMSINDFVGHGFSIPANNRQTRYLAGYAPIIKHPYDNDYRYFITHVGNDEEKAKEMLEIAKKNLDKMSWIGLAHRPEESVELLSYVFNFPHLLQYNASEKINQKPTKNLPYDAEIIKKHNSLDMELYEYAEKKFEDQYRLYKQCKDVLPLNQAPTPQELYKKRHAVSQAALVPYISKRKSLIARLGEVSRLIGKLRVRQ